LKLNEKHVAIIGGGVAGLTAADELARRGVRVSLIEKTPFLGGQAIQLACKATDTCVKCGACVVEDKLLRACQHSHVDFYMGTIVRQVSTGRVFGLDYEIRTPMVDVQKCDGCGLCFQKCPVAGALVAGHAPRRGPYVAIRRELCRAFDDAACTLCRDACPCGAITLSDQSENGHLSVDAVLVATGFKPYNPAEKSFGYSQFADVVTNLEAESILRTYTLLKRPSDGKLPGRIAFIQCVGSRDAKLGHSWCSKICCGSSLRMARLVQARQPQTQVTFFYIDIQTFGKDFQEFYAASQNAIGFVRAIPGDIFQIADGRLQVVYFDPESHESVESRFDMVILSAGLTPAADNAELVRLLNWNQSASGFIQPRQEHPDPPAGVFVAGSAMGPMTIAESVGSAGQAVWQIVDYIEGRP
jgi:heterodisulfide reductase subunit A